MVRYPWHSCLQRLLEGLWAAGSLWYAAPPPPNGDTHEAVLTSDGLPGPGHPEQLAMHSGMPPHELQAWNEITRYLGTS
ncbi:DUF6059 family protein [Kitasatospora sp. NBC_01302]|uniref:DUF6059 family protein n=1 Tax=Kitasatospora sp. NBC_01302 TaxID=2903575 RepID=UPI003FA39722